MTSTSRAGTTSRHLRHSAVLLGFLLSVDPRFLSFSPGTLLAADQTAGEVVQLPAPRIDGPVPIEQALAERRSVRAFSPASLTLAELGQLLWAAQGVTGPDGRRTAPSAGARFPLELYVVVDRVDGMERGVWRYLPARHELRAVGGADRIERLSHCVSGQAWVTEAAAIVVVSAVHERTERKYGSRAELYVAVEAGAAAQNLALQATALGLGSTIVGAFDERLIVRDVELRPGERPLVLVPVGRR